MTNNLKEIDMEDSEEVAPNIDSSDVKQLPCGGRICPLNLQFLQNKWGNCFGTPVNLFTAYF